MDEFSQFARMPAPRAVPADLHQLLNEKPSRACDGLSPTSRSSATAAELPLVRVDPEQMRRVIINLVDNAIEATDRRGTIVLETAHDSSNSLVRVTVADDGAGIPLEEREKLFLRITRRKDGAVGSAWRLSAALWLNGGSVDVADSTSWHALYDRTPV